MNGNIWKDKNTLQSYLLEVVRYISEQTDESSGEVTPRYRNVWNMDGLNATRRYIADQLTGFGYQVEQREFTASFQCSTDTENEERCDAQSDIVSQEVHNLIVEIPGTEAPDENIRFLSGAMSLIQTEDEYLLYRNRKVLPKKVIGYFKVLKSYSYDLRNALARS